MLARSLTLSGALAISAARVAAADDAPPSAPHAGVEYAVGPGCPTESEFWTAVLTHLRSPPSTAPLAVRVEAFDHEGRSVARITFTGRSEPDAVREISAESCREAIAASALVVALALDAPRERAPTSPSASTPAVPAPVPDPPLTQAVPEARPIDSVRPPAPRLPRGSFWQLGAGGLVHGTVAPAPMFGATAFAGMGEANPVWDVRASFVYARSGITERQGEAAEFLLLAGQLEGCALPIVSVARLVVGPCVAFEVGNVESRGLDSEAYAGSTRSTLWGAGGPLLGVRQELGDLHVEAFSGPWLPAFGVRKFAFRGADGLRTFHEVPAVGWVAGVRLAFHAD